VILLSGLTYPWSLEIDESSGFLYWTDRTTTNNIGGIYRANLDGSNKTELVTINAYPPLGLELDTVNGFIYWGNADEDKIQRSNLDGSGITDIVSGFESRDIALNGETGYLYASSADTIKQIGLDGSVFNIVTNLENPFGLSIDYKNDFLYWTDSSSGKIQRSNYDGSDVMDIVTGVSFPRGIDVALEPDLTVDDIIDFIVENEDIEGVGSGNSANNKYNAYMNMLLVTADLVDAASYDAACNKLESIFKKCDGLPKPPDFIDGNPDAMAALIEMFDDLMGSLGCPLEIPEQYEATLTFYTDDEGKNWITVTLTDEEGNPVANEKFTLYLPDGSVKKGRLDENGEAQIESTGSEDETINFPQLDSNSWHLLEN
jgi:hypothetical protein